MQESFIFFNAHYSLQVFRNIGPVFTNDMKATINQDESVACVVAYPATDLNACGPRLTPCLVLDKVINHTLATLCMD